MGSYASVLGDNIKSDMNRRKDQQQQQQQQQQKNNNSPKSPASAHDVRYSWAPQRIDGRESVCGRESQEFDYWSTGLPSDTRESFSCPVKTYYEYDTATKKTVKKTVAVS
jgi:transcription initiation factor TFIID subunit TAF12